MKIGKIVIAVVASVSLCLPALAPTTAEAATLGVPLTCGMHIDHDATLYLEKNLHCPSFGVEVGGSEWGRYPHVVVDLRGHTLSGSGTEFGILGVGFPMIWPSLEVKNGRLQGWYSAVAGFADGATVRNVVLTDNGVGVWCEGTCTVERSVFKDNRSGFIIGEGYATINRSVFRRNQVGAAVGAPHNGLKVSRSFFSANGIGVAGYWGSPLTVSLSTFIKNDTGVFYSGDCVTLVRDKFRHNGVDVDGPIC